MTQFRKHLNKYLISKMILGLQRPAKKCKNRTSDFSGIYETFYDCVQMYDKHTICITIYGDKQQIAVYSR